MVTEEELDYEIARLAMEKGWADNKCEYAARIIKILLPDVTDKKMYNNLKKVIKFLEEYRLEKEVE